jgi:hypothetical protein
MLVPVFVKDGTNTPYVQSMDEFYDIEDFFAYYQYENFPFVSEHVAVEAEIGRAGLIAFRKPLGEIWCGDVGEAIEYLNLREADLDDTPLLKLQLLRILNAPLAEQYAVWRKASERYFKSARQRAHWLDAELLGYQSNDRVWNRINSKRVERRAKLHSVADRFESVDPERRFAVLSNPAYFEFSDWEIEWFKLKEQLPTDERVYLLANEWLYSVFASNREIGRTNNVFAESLRFGRTRDDLDDQFADFISELLRSGQFFSDDLALSFPSLLAALDLTERFLPDEDYIALLLQVLADNYFSSFQTQTLLTRLNNVARPKRVLVSDLGLFASRKLGDSEIITLEVWKDVAASHQELLKVVLNRMTLLDESEPVVRSFIRKWKPLLGSGLNDGL